MNVPGKFERWDEQELIGVDHNNPMRGALAVSHIRACYTEMDRMAGELLLASGRADRIKDLWDAAETERDKLAADVAALERVAKAYAAYSKWCDRDDLLETLEGAALQDEIDNALAAAKALGLLGEGT